MSERISTEEAKRFASGDPGAVTGFKIISLANDVLDARARITALERENAELRDKIKLIVEQFQHNTDVALEIMNERDEVMGAVQAFVSAADELEKQRPGDKPFDDARTRYRRRVRDLRALATKEPGK